VSYLLRLVLGPSLFLAGCCYHVPGRPTVRPAAKQERTPQVRVRLSASGPVGISGSAGLELSAGRSSTALGPGESVVILPGPGPAFRLPGRPEQRLQDTLRCHPGASGLVRVGERQYRGSIFAFPDSTRVLVLVNVLPLEEYLFSVVSCEIGATDPAVVEAVKAQAVAARSFTLARVARRRHEGHDVWDTYLRDQEYRGAGSETELARQAVLSTRGLALSYQGSPAEALYHANCGGRTSDGFQPFLRGVVDAAGPRGRPYCAGRPGHDWEVKLSRDRLESAVSRAAGEPRIRIRRVAVDRDERSGRVRYIRFTTDKGEVRLTGADFRAALGLKSQSIEVRLERSVVTITGRGHGHGFGMCQDGAVGMARSGAGFRAILRHYYAGVELRQFY